MVVRVSVSEFVYVSVLLSVYCHQLWICQQQLLLISSVFWPSFDFVNVAVALIVVVLTVGTYSHVQLIAFNLLDFISVFR